MKYQFVISNGVATIFKSFSFEEIDLPIIKQELEKDIKLSLSKESFFAIYKNSDNNECYIPKTILANNIVSIEKVEEPLT